MPPPIALLICIFVILYLFWMDRGKAEGVSNAIWIPFTWMFLAGSRFVSQWLELRGPDTSGDSMMEGSPFDRIVFTVLIMAGVFVLRQRRADWKALFADNKWIWLYFAFGALSFLWSDYPFVSFKRWVKALGTVVMVLVILTEQRPYLAIGVILRRLSFILIPLSVLFVKYYPHLGRGYHMGSPMYTGVSGSKNGLGMICLFASIYFAWNLLLGRRGASAPGQRLHHSIYLLMFPMIAWLFHMADSATSFACMLMAVGLFLLARNPSVAAQPGRIITFCIVIITLFGILQVLFDVKDTVITLLGRRPDLTTRLPMWEGLLSMNTNPIGGVGFESFWLGERRQYVSEVLGIPQRQAHNGYLEMYLNMGLIGLACVFGWFVSGIRKVYSHLSVEYENAVLKLCLIVVAALYNYTEATFYGVSNMWILLTFAVMGTPGGHRSGPWKKIISHLACLLARHRRYARWHKSRYAPKDVP